MTRMNQNKNHYNLQRKLMLIQYPGHSRVTLSSFGKIIDQLSDSAEGKVRCILSRWVGIYNNKDDVYLPTCNINFYVMCYCSFHSDVRIVNMEDSIYTIYKRFKSQNITNLLIFCCIYLYATPTQPFWSLYGVYSNKLFFLLSKKNKILLINC